MFVAFGDVSLIALRYVGLRLRPVAFGSPYAVLFVAFGDSRPHKFSGREVIVKRRLVRTLRMAQLGICATQLGICAAKLGICADQLFRSGLTLRPAGTGSPSRP